MKAMIGEETITAKAIDYDDFNAKYKLKLDEESQLKFMGPSKVVYTTNGRSKLITSLFSKDDIDRCEKESDQKKEVTTISINKMLNMIVVGFIDGTLEILDGNLKVLFYAEGDIEIDGDDIPRIELGPIHKAKII